MSEAVPKNGLVHMQQNMWLDRRWQIARHRRVFVPQRRPTKVVPTWPSKVANLLPAPVASVGLVSGGAMAWQRQERVRCSSLRSRPCLDQGLQVLKGDLLALQGGLLAELD